MLTPHIETDIEMLDNAVKDAVRYIVPRAVFGIVICSGTIFVLIVNLIAIAMLINNDPYSVQNIVSLTKWLCL